MTEIVEREKGVRRTAEEKERLCAEVEQLRAQGVNTAEACQRLGFHYTSYFKWRNPGAEARPQTEAKFRANVSLSFESIEVGEARKLVAANGRSTRFSVYIADLVTHLTTLQANQAMKINLPRRMDKKEAKAVIVATKAALVRREMQFTVRQIGENALIVIRKEDLKGVR